VQGRVDAPNTAPVVAAAPFGRVHAPLHKAGRHACVPVSLNSYPAPVRLRSRANFAIVGREARAGGEARAARAIDDQH